MSKWFPDVSTQEGIQSALKNGTYGALGHAASLGIGFIFTVVTRHLPAANEPAMDGAGLVGALVGIGFEIVLALVAAWRFNNGKGLIWGSVTILVFLLEMFGKFSAGTTSVGWIFFWIGIGTGLLNGIRGAWANRSELNTAENISEIFE